MVSLGEQWCALARLEARGPLSGQVGSVLLVRVCGVFVCACVRVCVCACARECVCPGV